MPYIRRHDNICYYEFYKRTFWVNPIQAYCGTFIRSVRLIIETPKLTLIYWKFMCSSVQSAKLTYIAILAATAWGDFGVDVLRKFFFYLVSLIIR